MLYSKFILNTIDRIQRSTGNQGVLHKKDSTVSEYAWLKTEWVLLTEKQLNNDGIPFPNAIIQQEGREIKIFIAYGFQLI